MIERGLSQVLFSFLPSQTADLGGGVHKVIRWAEPRYLSVDADVVRGDLERAVHSWNAADADDGITELLRGGHDIEVISPSARGGVEVKPFPDLYRCRQCGRLRESSKAKCPCGGRRWTHFPFVAYHECGRIETPWIKACDQHGDRRLYQTSKSTQTRDLVFDCPVCKKVLQKGFAFLKCDCRWGGTLKYNVHRAAVVYTPRSTVIVNPPDPTVAAELKSSAAAAQTLRWVVGGMRELGPLDTTPTLDTLIAAFVAQGIDEETARAMAEAAAAKAGGQVTSQAQDIDLPPDVASEARGAALKIAYATAGGRVRIEDLVKQAGPQGRARYESLYRPAVADAGLESVELLEKFPVLTAAYGYTRGDHAPGGSTLRWFKGDNGGAIRLHGLKAETEALLFRLDPLRVARWLEAQGRIDEASLDPTSARITVLRQCRIPLPGDDPSLRTSGADLLRLIHSMAHRTVRKISAFSGIERDGLGEYLIPLHLAFVVFANTRGDFVLGGLQALFENDLDGALHDVVHSEHRCALDPGCEHHGAACVVCLHLGEPSCRHYNQFLSRATLFGPGGFLS